MNLREQLILDGMLMKGGRTSFTAKKKLTSRLTEVINATSFLDINAPLLQRWFHIFNELPDIPKCECCKSVNVEWKQSNKYRETCSLKCHHLLKSDRATRTKLESGSAKLSYVLRNNTLLAKDPDALKKIGAKGARTRKARGTDLSGLKKALITMKADIDINGMSKLQLRRMTQHTNAKKTVLPNGITKAEQTAQNISNVLKQSDKQKTAAKRNGLLKRSLSDDGINSIASLISTKGAVKCRITKEKNGTIIPLTQLTSAQKYIRAVIRETNKQDLKSLLNIDKRGNHALDKDAWHLDHKFSIVQGFLQNISPKIVGNICNLEMLPWRDNVSKSGKCSITLEMLLEEYYIKASPP